MVQFEPVRPRWATTTFTDGDLREWAHRFGEAPSDAGDEALIVDAVQTVTGMLDGSMVEGPVQVRVAGIRLRRNDAEHLARMLTEAVNVIDRATPHRPASARVTG